MMRRWMVCLTVAIIVMGGCGSAGTPLASPIATDTVKGGTLMLSSTAFEAGKGIPVKYTCDGQKVSVPLSWGDPPVATKSFALIVDDPDAPGRTFVHWVLFNIPPTARLLPEGVKADPALADGSRNGNNGASQSGYTGPCPPNGIHRYFFKLYSLDTMLTLNPGASKDQVLTAMQGHILAQGELMGTYIRNR